MSFVITTACALVNDWNSINEIMVYSSWLFDPINENQTPYNALMNKEVR